jgi:hypothetical protein
MLVRKITDNGRLLSAKYAGDEVVKVSNGPERMARTCKHREPGELLMRCMGLLAQRHGKFECRTRSGVTSAGHFRRAVQ